MFASRRQASQAIPSTQSRRRRHCRGAASPPGLQQLRIEPLEERQMLSVFTVDRLDDGPVAAPDQLPGSLRQAIYDANHSDGADSIDFAPDLSGTIHLTEGELAVIDSVTIAGPGPNNLTIDANNLSRIFKIDDATPAILDVTIDGLTFTGGRAWGGGGAISAERVNLQLRNSILTGNTARYGEGGALEIRSEKANTTLIENCQVTGNTSEYNGGGLCVEARGTLTIRNSTISGNATITGDGGALEIRSEGADTTLIENCQVTGNTSTYNGGGLCLETRGTLTIRNSTISGNATVNGNGGGILTLTWRGDHAPYAGATFIEASTISDNSATGCGGGVAIVNENGGTTTVRNSTISGNSARVAGGGIWAWDAYGGATQIQNSTIADNRANSDNDASGSGGGLCFSYYGETSHPITITSTIIAGNADSVDSPQAPDVDASASTSRCLVGENTGADLTDDGSSVIGTAEEPIDSGLLPLADNGGPTLTHALLPNSPAIDGGSNPAGLTADQRGFPRVAGAGVDMGAFEAPDLSSLVLLVTNTNDEGPGSLRQAILDANAALDPAEIRFQLAPGGTNVFEDVDAGLPGGDPAADVFVIRPRSPLPAVKPNAGVPDHAVVIDGRSQASWAEGEDTNPFGPEIVLDGSLAAPDVSGLEIWSGASEVRGLAIQRFGGNGISVLSASGIVIAGNYIGVDATGTQSGYGNGRHGIAVQDSNANTIGGTAIADGNVISGNAWDGILISGQMAWNNQVLGNRVGTDASGAAAIGNRQSGVHLDADTRENAVGSGNLISGNGNHGVNVSGGAIWGNRVSGNRIGVNADGTAALSNAGDGVHVEDSFANQIGGLDAWERNIISGNGGAGVGFAGANASRNVVQGNYIGTDVGGMSAIPNGWDGVRAVGGAHDNVIGGTAPGAGNLLSGNTYCGVALWGARSFVIQGNLAGTDASGKHRLGNGYYGICVGGGAGHQIGGAAPGAGNLISGNGLRGIDMREGGSHVTIQGNRIGTDITGTAALGNAYDGILIFNCWDNLVGGTTPGAGNLISGNGARGICFSSGSATGTRVLGNQIGTDVTGQAPLGNREHGVLLWYAGSNIVGGTRAGEGNTIAFNGGDGVSVEGDSADAIRGNSIWRNGELGIDLGNDGLTPNDHLDSDNGANILQNFPVILLAQRSDVDVRVGGTLYSSPITTYDLDFYSNLVPGASGQGEGQTYLGSAKVTTSVGGDAAFSVLLAMPVGPGQFVTATATDPYGNTSEFSLAVMLNAAPVLSGVPSSATVPELQLYTFDADAADSDVPVQTLRFSLVNAPSGAAIDPVTGVFTWTPSETEGPDNYTFAVRVSDGVANTDHPATLTVAEVNAAPVLSGVPSSATIPELQLYTFDADAADSDLPAQTLTFSLVNAPSGTVIDPVTGVFTWTPTEAQGPGSYTFTVKVTDNGSPPLPDEETITVTVNEVPQISINDVAVREGNPPGTTWVTFAVSLSASSDRTVSVNFATQECSAVAFSDYTPGNGQLNFSPGQTQQSIRVTVTRDKLYEYDETFFVNLTNPVNGTLGRSQGTCTIINDDANPTITISGVKKREGNFDETAFDFVVTLSKVCGRDIYVDYFTKDGTAKNANDYEFASGTLTIPAGAKTAKIPVWVHGDSAYERNETFQVVLSSPDGATIAKGKAKATGTIVNDDKRQAAAFATLVQPKQRRSSVGTPVDAALTDLLYGNSGSDWWIDFPA